MPSVLAFVLYGDSLTPVKILGLSAALVALFLCTAPEKHSDERSLETVPSLPLLVFATFGCYFTILKYLQTYYLDGSTYHAYVMSAFVFAFVSSLAIGFGGRVFSAADFRAVASRRRTWARRHQLCRRVLAAAHARSEGLGELAALSDLQRRRGGGEHGAGVYLLSRTAVATEITRIGSW